VNLKSEVEIRMINEKIDKLISTQWQRLLEIQEMQMDFMEELTSKKRVNLTTRYFFMNI